MEICNCYSNFKIKFANGGLKFTGFATFRKVWQHCTTYCVCICFVVYSTVRESFLLTPPTSLSPWGSNEHEQGALPGMRVGSSDGRTLFSRPLSCMTMPQPQETTGDFAQCHFRRREKWDEGKIMKVPSLIFHHKAFVWSLSYLLNLVQYSLQVMLCTTVCFFVLVQKLANLLSVRAEKKEIGGRSLPASLFLSYTL